MRFFEDNSLPRSSRIALLLLALFLASCSSSPNIPDQARSSGFNIVKTEAERRVSSWKRLLASASSIPEERKLTLANEFINRLVFINDRDHWGQEDYWATPIETIYSGGGDCEDLAIAKYFTLKYLHVPDERLRLVYVRVLSLNQPHMVLMYYPSPQSQPLVLDNLDPTIKNLSQRTDLRPFYGFNIKGFWLTRKSGSSDYVGRSDQIGLWQQLLVKMSVRRESL